jgi:hypothetical protein
MAAKEDQIIWTIFGVFWAANAVLLVALFTEEGIPTDLVCVIVSFVGVLFSVIWCLIQQRAINWLKYFEKLIYNIEEKLEESLSAFDKPPAFFYFWVAVRFAQEYLSVFSKNCCPFSARICR